MSFHVNFADIIKYVGDGLRAYEEGERVLNAKHLVTCAVCSKSPEKVEVMGLCLQTSALFSNPHEIRCILQKNPPITCKCSCKAGLSGVCKHSVALLMHINRVGLDALEEASRTDMQQQWGKLKKSVNETYVAAPIETFCHYKKRKVLPPEAPSNENVSSQTYLRILLKGSDDSELAKVIGCARSCPLESLDTNPTNAPSEQGTSVPEMLYSFFEKSVIPPTCYDTVLFKEISPEGLSNVDLNSLRPELRQVYIEHVQVSKEESMGICVKTMCQKGEFWHKERKKRITASTAYNLFTYSRNKEPNWDAKIQSHLNCTFKGNAATAHGQKMEEKARKRYEEMYGYKVEELGLIVSPASPWVAYSPDGIVKNKCIIEIKCPVSGKELPASQVVAAGLPYLTRGENVMMKKKHPYYGQVQLGMAVTGMHLCHFIVYSSFDNSICVIVVDHDEVFVLNKLFPCLREVYFKHILSKVSKMLTTK